MDDPLRLLAQAEEAEWRAARCYNVVEYAEHLEAARALRARAAAAAGRTEGEPSDEKD